MVHIFSFQLSRVLKLETYVSELKCHVTGMFLYVRVVLVKMNVFLGKRGDTSKFVNRILTRRVIRITFIFGSEPDSE